jgi:hypothetical protein
MDGAAHTPARCHVYRRRRPERTPLYRAVQGHLETHLALAREGHDDGEGVPQYVEREFRRYLECGILAHGFARARCGQCGHDFLIAFSCKGRGLCPSCNARRMAQTAAHLVDQVFPPLPVRQWVLSVPKRLRYFLQHEPEAIGAVLHIFLRVIEARLRQGSSCARGRLGAVSFVQRFGSALNAHVHFHCCVIDGVFAEGKEGQVQFAEAATLTPEDLAAVQQQVRTRVLRWFARAGHLDAADARDMASWDHRGGFSLNASVRIEGPERRSSPWHARSARRYRLPLPRSSPSARRRATCGPRSWPASTRSCPYAAPYAGARCASSPS